jgi:adenylylsulfate kinase
MPIFQFTGLSGSGKTTLAEAVAKLLIEKQLEVEIIDGDVYRKTLCADLSFSRADREENIRRLGLVAKEFDQQNKIVLIAAINPFESVRKELTMNYNAKVIWLQCDLDTLVKRDTKGLYRKAYLPEGHPEKLHGLTGVSDLYEEPENADLVVNTGLTTIAFCAQQIVTLVYQPTTTQKIESMGEKCGSQLSTFDKKQYL